LVVIPSFLHRERFLGQFVRFAMVGALNTLVDLAAFYLLGLIPGMPDVAAKAVSYALGICNSFLWNKYWTFSAGKSERGFREFLVFVTVNLPPLIINVVVFTILGIWINDGDFFTRMGKAISSAVVSVAWNFMGSRYLAFRHSTLKAGTHE